MHVAGQMMALTECTNSCARFLHSLSQHAANLSSEVIHSQFGEVVEAAAAVLAAGGALTVQQLAERLPKSWGCTPREYFEHAKAALVVLMQVRRWLRRVTSVEQDGWPVCSV